MVSRNEGDREFCKPRARRPPGQRSPPAGAWPYKRDLPNVEIHMIDTGHFALETNGTEIAAFMREFLGRVVPAG